MHLDTDAILANARALGPAIEAAADDIARDRRLPADLVESMRRAGILEQMEAAHPKGPHWHLAFIGVDPAHQGRGIGAALLRHTLARVDEDHLPSYLESSNPANISLYRRHGFEVVREIRVGGAPLVTPMIRDPR